MPQSWKQSQPTRQVRQAFASSEDKSFLLLCRDREACAIAASELGSWPDVSGPSSTSLLWQPLPRLKPTCSAR